MTYNVQLVSHYDNSVTDRESNSSADESASTASTGTMVALGFVFWAKRYNKCCFQKDGGGSGRDAQEDFEVAMRLTDQMDNGDKMPPSSLGAPPPYEEVEKIGVSTALSI